MATRAHEAGRRTARFFEFSTQRASITCPLMAQKCMATPAAIADAKFSLTDLVHVYEVTPDFSARLLRALPQREDARSHFEAVLRDDWGFAIESGAFESIASHLGV